MSNFRFYSYAVSVADKEINMDAYEDFSFVEDVHEDDGYHWFLPIEIVPVVDGKLEQKKRTLTVSGKDSKDTEYTIELKTAVDVKARYFDMGSTPGLSVPKLSKGECVMLWSLPDDDGLYWTPVSFKQHLRRLDHHVQWVSATKDTQTPLAFGENVYTFEISPINKRIRLQNSLANEEVASYTFLMDAGIGQGTFADNMGNGLFISSLTGQVILTNNDDSRIFIEEDTVRLATAPGAKVEIKDEDVTLGGTIVTLNGEELHLNSSKIFINGMKIEDYIKMLAEGETPPAGGTTSGLDSVLQGDFAANKQNLMELAGIIPGMPGGAEEVFPDATGQQSPELNIDPSGPPASTDPVQPQQQETTNKAPVPPPPNSVA